jgi:putative transposase
VDQNPVRAHLVAKPEFFAWSSYRARAGFDTGEWLDLDPVLADLAPTSARRFDVYREIAGTPCSDDELRAIRGALRRNQLTGTAEFGEAILRDHGVEVSARSRGRPAKSGTVDG